jgi:hypothetical protein
VTTIPVATAIAERAVRGNSPIVLGAVGASLLALGLFLLSRLTHRQPGWVVVALALCGIGIGLGFPGLTSAALRSAGTATARAAKTVAARDAGLVVGLLVLTPVFVNQINAVEAKATGQATGAVLFAPVSLTTKAALAPKLQAAANSAPPSRPPDFGPAFAQVSAGAPPAEKVQLKALQARLDAIVERAVTDAFRQPLLYAALFAVAVLPLLGLRVLVARNLKTG